MIDCAETLTTSVELNRISKPSKYFIYVATSYEYLEYIRNLYILRNNFISITISIMNYYKID